MNNFTFGNDRYQYYETICGGSGAGPGFDGTDAVHTHMTNSRLTDPEVLEWRFPVLVEAFSIRRGSGGQGRLARRRRRGPPHPVPRSHDRGDPVRPSRVAALRHGRRRRRERSGATACERADGAIEVLGGTDQTEMAPGDVFVIETPGGGGYGPTDSD